MRCKLAATLAVAGLIAAMTAPAALAVKPAHKCNAGAGNGSEPAPGHDCDPGKSAGNNNGGD